MATLKDYIFYVPPRQSNHKEIDPWDTIKELNLYITPEKVITKRQICGYIKSLQFLHIPSNHKEIDL